jgi:hypothetical protein
MEIIFLGGEVPSNRELLIRNNVKSIGLNYWSLKRRGLPKTKDYLLSERYPDDVKVYVDGGTTAAAKAGLSVMELEEFCEEYQDWVSLNEDRIAGATEFTHPALGDAWTKAQRETFWAYTPEGVFWPVWTGGHIDLAHLASKYDNIAIPGDHVESDKALAAKVRALGHQYRFDVHGIACAKPDNMRQVPFKTASTLSWLSPMMRGETIVWDGNRLVRYPKKMKDQARPRYKRIIEEAGLDFDKILADDPVEVTSLAIWSYLELEKTLDNDDSLLSDNSDYIDDPGDAETGGANPDNSVVQVRKEIAEVPLSEMKTLPVFGVEHRTVIDHDSDGRTVIKNVPVISSSSVSLRQCDTCFVASNCPAFKPQSACSFNLPVEVKTKDQLRALLNAIIEMQGARVAFARFSEELNGGYPDPNTGQEIDRLFKIVEQLKKLESNNEFVRMTVERQTNGGILSNLFGEKATPLKDLPNDGLDEIQVTQIISDSID